MFRKVATGVCGLALVTAATTGCGADTAQACSTIKSDITDISSKAMSQIDDPAGLAATYRGAAEKIKSEGAKAGGDVEDAANDAADALNGLADAVTGHSTAQPDLSPLVNAGKELQSACT